MHPCDAAFGRDTAFRDALAAQGYWYLARVPSDTLVFTELPQVQVPPYRGRGRPPCKMRPSHPPRTVAQVAADPGTVWHPVTLAEGAKGPIVAEVTRLRVFEARGGLPREELWLLVRVPVAGDSDGL